MIVLVRGGGDLASGVALRLHRAGFQVVITEIERPMAVRRLVAFSEAVYRGQTNVEEVKAVLVPGVPEAHRQLSAGNVTVLVDPAAENRHLLRPSVLVDGRMTKAPPDLGKDAAPLVIGLGPGFNAGQNCHAVIETHRSHRLGRVIWQGEPEPDTGVPEAVHGIRQERVLRAPLSGILSTRLEICASVETGQPIADVDGHVIRAPFSGVLRGLLPAGVRVQKGLKIGDVDPRGDPTACHLVSDKALAIGGGVLEAILSRPELRHRLWA